jgi:hypothetical protein
LGWVNRSSSGKRSPIYESSSILAISRNTMLEGTYAFEKRWSELRERYPTTASQDALIVRAINQLSSNHGAVNDITETLPESLRTLFRELAQAYLKAQRDAAHPVQEQAQKQAQKQTQNNLTFETLVIDQPSRLRPAPTNSEQDEADEGLQPLPEANTLIVDQPTSLGVSPESVHQSAEQPTLRQTSDTPIQPKKTSPSVKSAPDVSHGSLEEQLQALAEKRKYVNQYSNSKSKLSTGKNYKQSHLQQVNPPTPNREDMAQILPSDRPRIRIATTRPGVLKRLLNWLFG